MLSWSNASSAVAGIKGSRVNGGTKFDLLSWSTVMQLGTSCMGIFLYVDDVILLSSSGLQPVLDICDLELSLLDMSVNARKSACIPFSRNYSRVCDNMIVAGNVVNWVT